MGRLLKLLFILLLLAFIGLLGYAFLGDLSPSQVEVNEAVILDVE